MAVPDRPEPTQPAQQQAADAPTKRGVELAMLIFAAVVVTAALIVVQVNMQQEVSASLLYYGAAYLGLFTVAHIAVRWLAPYADPLILPLVALLNGLGLVLLHRLELADAPEGSVASGSPIPDSLIGQQTAWTALGVLLFVAVLAIIRDHRMLLQYAYTIGLIGLVFLALPPLLPPYSGINGAAIWIYLGPFSIQPGEFTKIALIVFFGAFLVGKRELFATAGRRFLGMELPRARDLAPLLVAWGGSLGILVFEHDLGMSLLFFSIILVMVYVATARVSWLVIGLGLFMVGAVVAYQIFGHVQNRVAAWLHPFADYSGDGYQIAQSLFAIAGGALFGTGLGLGQPALIPAVETDFITAVIAEELGLVGFTAVMLVYLLLVMRGMRAALAVRDTFGKLLAAGLAATVGLQLFIVVGGVTNLIPLTGLTTPFLSYGGSSLLSNYLLVALLLRVSDAARRPTTPAQRPAAPLAEAHTEMVKVR